MAAGKAQDRAGHKEVRTLGLTARQVGAIRLAAEVGDDIRTNRSGIAEEYRSGLTVPKLVARHGLECLYGVSRPVAIAGVRNALCGYSGPYHEPYQGLIEDRSEREELAFAHNRQTGAEEYERRRGIHALTHEQKVAAGRIGGLIRGPLSYRLRIGCHALPPEVLREHCRRIAPLGGKAGGAALLASKGLVAYAPATPGRLSEIEFAARLARDPRYLGPGRSNFGKMAEQVNRVFHAGNPRYTRTTLKIALLCHRRHGCPAAESPVGLEMTFAEALSHDPAFQLPARMRAAEIARIVNEEYHGGKPVRNSPGIRAAIRRYAPTAG
jgi:hypothetical protein